MIRIRLAVFLLSLLIVFSGRASGWQQNVQNPAPLHAVCRAAHHMDEDDGASIGGDEDEEEDGNVGPLMNHIEDDDLPGVKRILAKGCEVNREYDCTFPLIKAAEKNNPEMVIALLKDGADPNAQDWQDRTALVTAIMTNTPVLEMPQHTGVVMALLDHGASATIKCDKGWTPLIYAAWFGNTTDLRLMLDKADLDSQDVQGRTALMWAAAQGHEDIVRALLDKGADTQLKDSEGQTAAMLADDNDQIAIVQLFKKGEAARQLPK